MKRPTTFKLPDSDAALILRASGHVEMLMPKQDGDALVPDHVMQLLRCITLLHDERAEALRAQVDLLIKAH